MAYDYSALKGKIIEVFGTVRDFSSAMDWSEATGYKKVNGEAEWKATEISKAARMLNVPGSKLHTYFFTEKVEKNTTF